MAFHCTVTSQSLLCFISLSLPLAQFSLRATLTVSALILHGLLIWRVVWSFARLLSGVINICEIDVADEDTGCRLPDPPGMFSLAPQPLQPKSSTVSKVSPDGGMQKNLRF